jgi:hypothetical protein
MVGVVEGRSVSAMQKVRRSDDRGCGFSTQEQMAFMDRFDADAKAPQGQTHQRSSVLKTPLSYSPYSTHGTHGTHDTHDTLQHPQHPISPIAPYFSFSF